jgi:8-oxo-dGTP diphosphatase
LRESRENNRGLIVEDATLVFLVRGHPPTEILIGFKKSGFGTGKYDGFGGKIEANETIEIAAARELWEESGIQVAVGDLKQVARLEFVFPAKPDWNQIVYAFLAEKWTGEPIETDEMQPAWFNTDSIPYDKMWDDSAYWVPLVLRGKRIEAIFTYKPDNATVDTARISTL